MHGYKVSHNSKTCGVTGRKLGHDELVTVADAKGVSNITKIGICRETKTPDGVGWP